MSPTRTACLSKRARFRSIRLLGEGATGYVEEVEDRRNGGRFALKHLRLDQATPERVARFKDQFRSLERVLHPNLAKVYELISDQSGISVLMELVEGEDFLRHVCPAASDWQPHAVGDGVQGGRFETGSRDGVRGDVVLVGRPDLQRLRTALPQLVSGLCALHAVDKIHCDIKPQNVLVTPSQRVVILDFGLVSEKTCGPGNGWGTPAYMAPEQFDGVITEAADWYAVGVLLYAALAARFPSAGSCQALEHVKRVTRPIDPRLQTPNLPDNLVELALRLLEPAPRDRPQAKEIMGLLGMDRSSRVQGPLPFSGREVELSRLAERFEQVVGGKTRVVHVRAQAGMGKSALIGKFLHSIQKSDATIIHSACYMDVSIPYQGLDGIMDHLAARIPVHEVLSDARDRNALARMFPVFQIGNWLLDTESMETEIPLLRARAIKAIRTMLRFLVRKAPLVICIEDLHWSDSASVDLLTEILRSASLTHLLLVLSYRTGGDGTLGNKVRSLRRNIPCHEDLNLGSLSAAAVRTMVKACDGHARLEEIHKIIRASRGHPLLARELIRAWQEGLDLEMVSLESLLAHRMEELDAVHRRYLECVAIAGRPINEDLLRAALGISPEEALAARRVLLAASFIRMAEIEEHSVEMYHHHIREHVLNGLTLETIRLRLEVLARTDVQLPMGEIARQADEGARLGPWVRQIPFTGAIARESLRLYLSARRRLRDVFRASLERLSPGDWASSSGSARLHLGSIFVQQDDIRRRVLLDATYAKRVSP